MDRRELIEKAINARNNSYCPYSNYAVGAAALASSGNIYTGCNVENASYGATICAERVAVFNGIANGERQFEALAIVGGRQNEAVSDYAYPCGVCRQVLREFSDPGRLKVIVVKSIEEFEEYSLEELLPHSFGPEKL